MIRPPFKPLRQRATNLPYATVPVSIPSGGQTLSGWVLSPDTDNGGPVLVLVHGWGSNHGTVARLAGPLLGAGYPVVLFDVRHHGESRGAPYVTARHFRDDMLSALREAEVLFPGRSRVLLGHSMGGSTGILAVSEGAPVVGLVTIGAPADLWEVWAYHLQRRGIPGRFAVRLLSPFWRIRAGVPWATLDPRERARRVAVPLLVVHGENDESVPASHARTLAEAAGVEAHILPGMGHTDLLESGETLALVLDFVESVSN